MIQIIKQLFCQHAGKVPLGAGYDWCPACDKVFNPKKPKKVKNESK